MSSEDTTIIKQVASLMTRVGFHNSPREASVKGKRYLTDAVFVVEVERMFDGPVFALVVAKAHKPLPAFHVVDFRIGQDIYG